ncbi:MAG: hypothetical protein PHT60_06370 [Acidiphilium sp.]|nr:hypothetical protein [Acidiphilium sp.]MDD4935390.1 hypothetical protein [Acidiphilium sp.]
MSVFHPVAPHRLHHHLPPLILLIALPLLANALLLVGALHNNPALFAMFLTSSMGKRLLLAAPGWFDPTIGLITQPLGMLSAKDWLAGIVPWWNPYSGVGMPLAAEMQTLSFFLPFVLLLKSWQGWLILKLLMQMLCGLFMYALLIELRTTRLAAFVAGALYALNATFFLVPHVMGPLPFAPLLLLGIERAHRAAQDGRRRGWGLIPLALAYSIYGGYPEVAYIDATLAAVWTIWRFAGAGAARGRFAVKIALGVGIGLALTLPLMVPFLNYVRLSYLGTHATKYAWLWLLPPGAPVQLFPFIYGPIGAPSPPGLSPPIANLIAAYWVQSAGWFGPVAASLAIAALARPSRLRGLALVLFGFILVWQARIWGFTPAIWLINLIPAMAKTDAMRFCGPAMEIACFIMAAIAVDAWQSQGAMPAARAKWAGIAAVLMALVALGAAFPALDAWFHAAPGRFAFAVTASAAEVVLAGLAFGLMLRSATRRTCSWLAIVVLADTLGVAAVTTLGAPRRAALDLGGVAYLQRHLGLERFYSLQPFGPNYPAAFRLAAIDENASPVSAAWNRYIHRHLDPYADVVMFTGSQARVLGCVLLPHAAAALRNGIFIRPQRAVIPPDQSAELRCHLAAYRAIGVKYVLTPPDQDPFVAGADLPVKPAARLAFALGAGGVLSGRVPAGVLDIDRIDRVDVLVGTYAGAARGTLRATICAGSGCSTGAAPLASARDNHFLRLILDHPLVVSAAEGLRYRFIHRSGSAVAIWLGALRADAPDSLAVGESAVPRAPIMRFVAVSRDAPPAPVFQDKVMRIYRLGQPRAFFTAAPVCRLTPHGINAVDADCTAPAVLLRLEAADPGWHARINGRAVPLMTAGSIFQSVALPAGREQIRFFYRPPFTRLSCAAALAALAIWLALMVDPIPITLSRTRPSGR